MKKSKIIIKFSVIGLLVLSSITACKKDYFDINENPNQPSDVDVRELLPSAEAAIAHAVGNNLQIAGGLYAQYWTQSPAASQYKQYEQYSPASTEFDNPWRIMYSDALTDLRAIQTKAGADGRTQYVAIAQILEAYTFQVLTDNFGDIPYSEAIKGTSDILSPKYDSQEAIYNGIISTLKSALATLDETATVVPGADDLIFQGDIALWREFGNTLLLRVYMRLSEVNPTLAAAGVAELETNGAAFLTYGENAQVSYLTEGGNTNPLYSAITELGSIQNLVASATTIDYMTSTTANGDPRVFALYAPSLNGSYVGLPQGLYTATPGTQTSYPSILTGGYADDAASAVAPVKLMSSYESFFLQSEAAARGWMTTVDPQLAYEDAIAESFTAVGLDATAQEYTDYITDPAIAYPASGTTEDQIKAIITQKWAAMCGTQNDEAWIEQRRTGYPDFFVVSANSLYGGSIFPERLLYASTEVTRNANFPGQKLIWDRVWWDTH